MSAWRDEVLAVHARLSSDDREAMAAHHAALVRAKRRQERWIAIGNVTLAVLFWTIVVAIWWRSWR